MNPSVNQNPPPNQPPLENQNRGSTVVTILEEPGTEDVNVEIVTRGGATN